MKKEHNKAKKYSEKKGIIIEKMNDTLKSKNIKNIELENYKFRVGWIKNYISKNIGEYFKYFKKECERQENEKTRASTIDGEIEYRLNSKEEKLEIKRDQIFYTLEYTLNKKKKSKKRINNNKNEKKI